MRPAPELWLTWVTGNCLHICQALDGFDARLHQRRALRVEAEAVHERLATTDQSFAAVLKVVNKAWVRMEKPSCPCLKRLCSCSSIMP